MEGNESLKKAKQEFDEIQKDEYEQKMAFSRLIHLMDCKSIKETGYDKGRIEEKKKIAKEMLKNNIDIEVIIKCTGLTKEEIENEI